MRRNRNATVDIVLTIICVMIMIAMILFFKIESMPSSGYIVEKELIEAHSKDVKIPIIQRIGKTSITVYRKSTRHYIKQCKIVYEGNTIFGSKEHTVYVSELFYDIYEVGDYFVNRGYSTTLKTE